MSKNQDQNLVCRNGQYYLRAYIKGQLIQRTLRTSDVKVARAERDKLIKEAENWAWRGNRKITWLDAVAEWIEHEGKHIPAQTAKRYSVSLKQIEPYFADLNISSINGKIIGDFIKARRSNKRSASTIKNDLSAISKIMDYAISEDWREDNPTLSRRRLVKQRKVIISLPQPLEVELLIASAPKEFGTLIRAAWLTGCRQNELVTARWRDYDPERKTLRVVGKGNKQRVISLRPIQSKDAAAFFATLPRAFGADLIFAKPNKTKFSQAASDFCHIRRALENRMKKEGKEFRRFRYHDLRHLFAVEALKGGMNIYDLQQHLGHTSVKTTEDYLAHLTPEEKAMAKGGTGYMQKYIQN